MFASLTTPALVGLFLATFILVTLVDWRLNLAGLTALFASAAVLIAQITIWQVVAVRILVGLLIVLILVLTGQATRFGAPLTQAPVRFTVPTGFAFRVMTLLLISITAWYVANQTAFALPGLPPELNLASYLLMAMGLLKLGLSEEPLNVGIGLFMLLSGFQLFYFVIEPSLAIVGLLAAVELAAALVVSYLAVLWYTPAEEVV